ncbi:MAG: SDR family oxidoreductase [Chloroflexi bacterium]|nr:SDR family oxidoreductase [Chloroflexota bacterium]
MKLLVIGATGRTGRHVLDQAIHRGHEVTAFARRPEKLAEVRGLKGVIEGDALNLEYIRSAVKGQDVVICAVGGSGIVRNLICALRETGAEAETTGRAQRIVVTSSRSVVATRPRFWVMLAWLIFREAYVDLARAEGMLEMSNLNWSIVRAMMLTDKPFTGRVHTDFEQNAIGGDWTLARADYAMVLLDVAENPNMIGKAVGASGAKPMNSKMKMGSGRAAKQRSREVEK